MTSGFALGLEAVFDLGNESRKRLLCFSLADSLDGAMMLSPFSAGARRFWDPWQFSRTAQTGPGLQAPI